MEKFRRTTVYLNIDLVDLANYKMKILTGKSNMTLLVNLLLEEFVTNGEDNKEENPVQVQVKALMDKKLADLRSQRKLIEETQNEQKKARDYQIARETAVLQAAMDVFAHTPNFEQYRPENDYHGDLMDRYFAVIDQISEKAGYDVTPSEVEKIWKSIKKQVEQQIESGAGTIRQEEPAPRHNTILDKEVKANEYGHN